MNTGSTILTLTPNLDLTANNINAINALLDKQLSTAASYETFELNLSQTENIDSVGVTFVISLFKRIKGLQKTFLVCGASEDVKSLFRLMKLDQFFEMKD